MLLLSCQSKNTCEYKKCTLLTARVSIARLETLEVANEKLSSLNNLSEKSFALHVAEFRTYTQTLVNMKKEIDSVFRRIR